MDVVDVPCQIGIVTDGMLPIAALPNAFLPLPQILLNERVAAPGRPRENPL